ncbi:larval cuticle protein LCP-22-like [Schistocerca piceifrons]|uniref:larval cuticle protein LCP-22-like n=1 Tax=Schistocerca piceifrons TaxID=274613 RepID=UPI001F5E65AB|nr:larval cuticle protein LCP-22-like [Schistocerca piceifrons]XP_049772189.1 larval cuticle protein LCP-22-like [Schistocerca cancellata]XP_049947355.1 larval cuticle protein LCP-22-like [Schistocerca serialis cubense]
MKVTLVCTLLAAAVALCHADAPFLPLPIDTLFRNEIRDEFGQYSLVYQTSNGITVTEQGELQPNHDGTDYVLVKKGSYSYTSPEGIPVHLNYKADANGFVAVSPNIPVPPSA